MNIDDVNDLTHCLTEQKRYMHHSKSFYFVQNLKALVSNTHLTQVDIDVKRMNQVSTLNVEKKDEEKKIKKNYFKD